MKLSECLTEPGQVAVRQADGMVAYRVEGGYRLMNHLTGYGVVIGADGNDWQRVWPVDDDVEQLKARIHELENPVLGEPLPEGHVILENTPYLYRNDQGIVVADTLPQRLRVSKERLWLDPRPMPKLPPEPEPRYTVECGATLWVVKRDGAYFCGVSDQADAERIARLLNESEASP